MAWVIIDGHKLLARLQSAPPVGARLAFIVTQLSPEIVLKEIVETPGVGADTLSIARTFETARTLFEDQFRHYGDSIRHAPPSLRLAHFMDLLESNDKIRATYLDTVHCAQAINKTIETNNKGIIIYQPWIVLDSRRQLTFIPDNEPESQSPIVTTQVEFETNELGLVRVDFIFKAPATGYRLKIQHSSSRTKLKHYLSSKKHPLIRGNIDCLDIAKLPPNMHGGILADLLFTA